MPSRPVVVVILLFWLAAVGTVVYRDVLPRYFGDAPPAPAYGPAEELSQPTVEWTIYRGNADEPIGHMTSRTEYRKSDNTFRYENRYRDVRITQAISQLRIPTATTSLRTDRDGRLKEQTLMGTAEVQSKLFGKLTATVEAHGTVENGVLVGSATLTCPEYLSEPSAGTFTPVPVPDGQVLNPLMPLDRLRDVVPGRHWVVQQVDPLRDALGQLLVNGLDEEWGRHGAGKKKPVAITIPKPPELVAKVADKPVDLDRPSGAVSCWVIEYTIPGKLEPTARTFVRRDDGRVLRQEATSQGERLRIERAE